MKVLVIGAAGKTGEAVVLEAVSRGHEVTAFVHSADQLSVPGVRSVEGDALDAAAISQAVAGQDAVIDTLGGTTPYKETTLESNVAGNVITAMQQHAARRLIVVSALGVAESKNNTSFVYEHLLMPTFLRGAMKDKASMEAEVKSSGLEWVIVRPALLTDDEPSGKVRTYTADDGDTAHKIARGDVAVFLVEQLESNLHVGKAVTIASV